MDRRACIACVLTAALLLSCRGASPGQPAPSPTALLASETTAPPPTATPSSTPAAGDGSLRALLDCLPPPWAFYHTEDTHGYADDLLGPLVCYLDVAQVRADLGLPTVASKDDRKAKLGLLTGLQTQGLPLVPQLDFTASDAYDEWGWDVADVDQVIYYQGDIVGGEISLLLGRFDGAAIAGRLLKKGYQQETGPDGLEVFNIAGDAPRFGVRALASGLGLLVIGRNAPEVQVAASRWREAPAGQEIRPYLASLLPYLEGAWGALLAPSGPMAGWHLMAMGFWGAAGPPTTLRFVYCYPSPDEAEADRGLVEGALTTAPSLATRGAIWGDKLTLQDLAVEDSLVIAEATTQSHSLIGNALTSQDYGFLPMRGASIVESDLATGWRRYERPFEGFALALPPTWQCVYLYWEGWQLMRQSLSEANPAAVRAMEQEIMIPAESGMLDFWAYDTTAAGEGAMGGTVAVTRVRLPIGATLDALVEPGLERFEGDSAAGRLITHGRVTLPAGEAEKIQYDSGQAGAEYWGTQYAVVQGRNGLVLSLSAPPDQAEGYAAVFEEIASSLEFIEP